MAPFISKSMANIGSKRLKPAKNKLTWCYFTSFSMQVSADTHDFRFWSLHVLHNIQNLSNRCRHKYGQSISLLFLSSFWRVFSIRPNCVAVGGKTEDFCSSRTIVSCHLGRRSFDKLFLSLCKKVLPTEREQPNQSRCVLD